MAVLLPWIRQQFFDDNGDPLEGGTIEVYQAGTSTPKAVYSDRDGLIPLPNPVELDSAGCAEIWMKPGSYKFILKNKNNVVVKTIDRVAPADGGGGGIVDEDYNIDEWSLRFNEQFVATGLLDWLTKIIKPGYQAPTLSLSGSSNVLREKGDSVASVTLTASYVKKSANIAEVRFYRNPSTVLDTQTSGGGIPSGGSSTYIYSTSFSDDVTFRAEVDDSSVESKPSASSTTTYSFVYPYFDGADASSSLTAAQVATKTKRIITTSSSITRSFTASSGNYLYFAQPSSYTALVKIYDENNFDVTASWTSFTGTYTANDSTTQTLRVYKLTNPVAAGTHTFRFTR